MSDVDRLFEAFVAAGREGEDVDPRSYLAQVDGRDRQELGVLIEGHLERAPRRRWDPQAFRGSSAERVVTALTAPAGAWPELLPELRDEAQLPRDELARRLASSLGVEDRADKVHRYYHEMEQGRLPASGVSRRVLEALGQLLGRSADALRRAGEGIGTVAGGAGAAPSGAAAFTRAVRSGRETPPDDAPPGARAEETPPAPASPARRADEEWDEVDELFRGGSER
jgi:hypothetical protein